MTFDYLNFISQVYRNSLCVKGNIKYLSFFQNLNKNKVKAIRYLKYEGK